MNKNSIVVFATGTLFASALAVAAGFAAARPVQAKLLPTVNISPALIEAEPEGDAKEAAPVMQIETISFDFGGSSETETSATKQTSVKKTPVASKKTTKKKIKKVVKKTAKKSKKKSSKKTVPAKKYYTYGTSRYTRSNWRIRVDIKNDDTARIEIVHDLDTASGLPQYEYWFITGKIDAKTGKIKYSGCTKKFYKYTNTGRDERTIYTNGNGVIEFCENSVKWTDNRLHDALATKFTKN
ncbi:MAG: hypothetical protein Q3987_01225 [Oscillospiraceae bacterium]|nr:hypothetical protein [Oscillospiraceae bacterium]